MSFSLKGRTAIVTGAGAGVGLAVAKRFFDEGANVVLNDPDEKKLRESAAHFSAKDDNVCIFPGDLQERLVLSNLMAACLQKFGRVDILVNGLRVIEQTDPFAIDDESAKEMIDKNVIPNLNICKAVMLQMCTQDALESEGETPSTRGVIVNMSSIFSTLFRPEYMGYSIATGAIENMTRAMAIAYAEKKIRVNAIAYGSVMGRNLLAVFMKNKSLREGVEKSTPLGRIANASEVAGAAQFLASDAAEFITGQVLVVDGGRTINDHLPGIVFS